MWKPWKRTDAEIEILGLREKLKQTGEACKRESHRRLELESDNRYLVETLIRLTGQLRSVRLDLVSTVRQYEDIFLNKKKK